MYCFQDKKNHTFSSHYYAFNFYIVHTYFPGNNFYVFFFHCELPEEFENLDNGRSVKISFTLPVMFSSQLHPQMNDSLKLADQNCLINVQIAFYLLFLFL